MCIISFLFVHVILKIWFWFVVVMEPKLVRNHMRSLGKSDQGPLDEICLTHIAHMHFFSFGVQSNIEGTVELLKIPLPIC